uniref:Uncharacterized protein n=1 Tax=Rhizophora mucronata TaxID=61149 RepID=A0A2P2JMS3_RHIMU
MLVPLPSLAWPLHLLLLSEIQGQYPSCHLQKDRIVECTVVL